MHDSVSNQAACQETYKDKCAFMFVQEIIILKGHTYATTSCLFLKEKGFMKGKYVVSIQQYLGR